MAATLGLLVVGCALDPLAPGAINASLGSGDPGPGDGDRPTGDSTGTGGGGSGGSGGGDNQPYEPVTCLDESLPSPEDRQAENPAAGDLVISEVFANPLGADLFADWLELYVAAAAPVDLNDVVLTAEKAGEPLRVWRLESETCRTFAPNTYVVIGASEDPDQSRGAPVDWSPGRLMLFHDEAITITLEVGSVLIDEAKSPAAPAGVSMGIDPGDLSATANDAESDFCQATTTDVFDETGTPGQQNDPCP